MSDPQSVGDDEILLRRVPPGETWLKQPGPVPSSLNVRLRAGEAGLSLSRQSIASPRRLIELGGGSAAGGWRVMADRAGDLRAFGLQVVPDETDEDPGHALVEPGGLDLTDKQVCRRLVQLFTLLPNEIVEPPPPVTSD